MSEEFRDLRADRGFDDGPAGGVAGDGDYAAGLERLDLAVTSDDVQQIAVEEEDQEGVVRGQDSPPEHAAADAERGVRRFDRDLLLL